jgi:hypothetical protein
MANRAAQIAITYSAPSVAAALLGLALEYMALADGLISVGRYLRKSSNCKKCSKILLAMEISRQAATRLEMWASDRGRGHEATAVHDAAWRRGGDVGHRARGISHEQDTARHGRTRRGEIQLRQRRGLLGRVSPACSVSFDQAGLHECSPSTSTRNALRSGLPKFRHAGSSARLRTSDTVLRAAFPVVKARISSGKVGHPGALRDS